MTIAEIEAEIQRGQLEAVRMLDAWASKVPGRAWSVRSDVAAFEPLRLRWSVYLDFGGRDGAKGVIGDSPEAARANAAEAIRGELP